MNFIKRKNTHSILAFRILPQRARMSNVTKCKYNLHSLIQNIFTHI